MAAKRQTTLDPALVAVDGAGALAALGEAGTRSVELVEAWLRAGNAAAVAAAARSAEGPARKAARRAASVLKSRGITLPEVSRPAPSQKSQDAVEAWLMAPDAAGNVAVVIAARSPAGRHRACFVFLHDRVGLHRVQLGSMSRTQLKDAFAKLLPGSGYGPTPVSVEYARWRVAAARALHSGSQIPLPLGLDSARDLLEPAPTGVVAHPFDAEGLELSQDDARERSRTSATLHRKPEFRAWVPTGAAINELLVAVGRGLSPGAQQEAAAIEARMKDEIEAATDRFFTPELREALLPLMKDCALSVLAREGEQAALDVVAAMTCVEHAGLVTDPPRDVPFLKAFFEKAVAMLAARGNGQLRIPVPALPVDADAVPVELPVASEPTASEPAEPGG